MGLPSAMTATVTDRPTTFLRSWAELSATASAGGLAALAGDMGADR
jgi:hypothetical protein